MTFEKKRCAIETHSLRKVFDRKVAVEDLTLQVEEGEVFGFLGPNGAGKTTSIKMLLGLTMPTSGDGKLFGAPIGEPGGRADVGFLPEHFRFHDWLNAREFLNLHADLYRVPKEQANRRIDDLLDLVGLAPHASKKLKQYSKGMLQRIGLAQALLNSPRLVILDEPTSGLDPVGRRLVRDIIRNLRERGTTVFLNSHLLSEVEITCDRVAFIKHGEVIEIQTLQSIMDNHFSVQIRARNVTPDILAGLARWSSAPRLEGEIISASVNEADLPEINRYLVAQGADIYAITPQRLSLEEIFIQIVGTDGGL